jgi:hypothetical protein
MTAVRAKFYVSEVDPAEGTSAAATVKLQAVCRGIENAMWAQATPWGNITMGIKNDSAVPLFEKGEEYEVTFRKVAKPTPGDGHPIKQATNSYGGLICETCGMQLGATQDAIDRGYWGRDATPGVRDDMVEAHDKHYGAPAE